jgi:hypothetical protein
MPRCLAPSLPNFLAEVIGRMAPCLERSSEQEIDLIEINLPHNQIFEDDSTPENDFIGRRRARKRRGTGSASQRHHHSLVELGWQRVRGRRLHVEGSVAPATGHRERADELGLVDGHGIAAGQEVEVSRAIHHQTIEGQRLAACPCLGNGDGEVLADDHASLLQWADVDIVDARAGHGEVAADYDRLGRDETVEIGGDVPRAMVEGHVAADFSVTEGVDASVADVAVRVRDGQIPLDHRAETRVTHVVDIRIACAAGRVRCTVVDGHIAADIRVYKRVDVLARVIGDAEVTADCGNARDGAINGIERIAVAVVNRDVAADVEVGEIVGCCCGIGAVRDCQILHHGQVHRLDNVGTGAGVDGQVPLQVDGPDGVVEVHLLAAASEIEGDVLDAGGRRIGRWIAVEGIGTGRGDREPGRVGVIPFDGECVGGFAVNRQRVVGIGDHEVAGIFPAFQAFKVRTKGVVLTIHVSLPLMAWNELK